MWLDALAEWNAKIDLTAAKDPRALVWLMLADAMLLARAVPQGSAVIDVGTGAGAPGLALALLRPDLRVTLCEPLGKRAAFLRSAIGALGRTDVTLEPKRVDVVRSRRPASGGSGGQLERGRFDVAISRATFSPSEWLAAGKDLARPGGSVWVFLAQDAPPESAGCTQAETLSYVDGATGASKRLVRYVSGGA